MEENVPIVQYWLDEIEAARKREEDFRKDGETIQKIYNGEMKDEIPFNILYSNTETLLPAVYSRDPRPVVRPKFKNRERDKLSNATSKAAERMLEYLIDNNMQGYEKFGKVMKAAAYDALLPGRGDITVKYDFEGDESNPDWEYACLECNKWNRVYYGHALRYSDAPWKAYELFLDKDEAKRLFKGKIKDLKFVEGEKRDDENDENENLGSKKTALVYQIWDRTKKEVIYISPYYSKGALKTEKDPLKLTGFFNSPPPLTFVQKTNDIVPTALYTLYENQAKELNEISRRIQKVTKAIKIRGAYNGEYSQVLQQIFDEDDNGLVPTDQSSSLMNDGGFEKNIWMLPFEKLVVVLQTLIAAREQVKQVIYEITGISDIVRGQSKASETLGAQQIKEAWGSMRIKPLQAEVQEFARDALRMLIDIAANKFSDESWIKMTGLPYLTDEQFAQAQRDLQMEKQQAMQMAQAQGQPPPPSEKAQMAMMALEQPKWSDVLKILRDDFVRSYLIDIETNSTLDVEATDDKKNISEFMNALAQFMNGTAPMVKDGILPFEAMKSMLLAITQNFRFGREVEEQIKKMKAPQNIGVDPKKMQEFQKKVQDLQKKEQTFQDSAQKASDKLDDEFMKLEQEKQQFEFDKKLFEKEMEFQKRMTELEMESDQKDAEMALRKMREDHKRDIQSMLDKQVSKIDKIVGKLKEIEKEEEMESETETENGD